jgi:hypothetical protein
MISIDATMFPLVVTTASGVLTDDEYRTHLAELTRVTVDKHKPYAYVYDGTGVENMAPSQRAMQAAWINEHRESIAAMCVGCGFAMPMFWRPVMNIIHLLSPPPYEYDVSGSLVDAIRWAMVQLEKHGLRPPYGQRDAVKVVAHG